MAERIFNYHVGTYSDSTEYEKYSLVKVVSGLNPLTELYFVSVQNNNSGNLDNVAYSSNSFWKRFGDTGNWRLDEVWELSYGTVMNFAPKNFIYKFGDGYEQRTPKGINLEYSKHQATMKSESLAEAVSLAGFLEWCGREKEFFCKISPITKPRIYNAESFKLIQNGLDTFDVNFIMTER